MLINVKNICYFVS